MMKKGKNSFVGGLLCLAAAVMIILTFPTEAEGAVYEDTVRLHILANSDVAVDQNEKIAVRDRVLSRYGEMLRYGTRTEAEAKLTALVPEIERDLNEYLSERGADYRASVTFRSENFERRTYGGKYTVPAGEYPTLCIRLGAAEGANWWCVLYPPLCLDLAVTDGEIDGYTKAENDLVLGGYRVKLRLLEIASDVFGRRR